MKSGKLTELESLRTPKLDSQRNARWYRYYAGFSTQFVSDVCDLFNLDHGQCVLDPWMGSGTTLSVAARRGYCVNGLDLNPVMSVIAKGRLVAEDTRNSIEPLLKELTRHWRASQANETDMLTNWFTVETAAWLRGLAHRIDSTLIVDHPDPVQKVERMSSLAAIFYVALFEAVTFSLKGYSSRNPTWIKRGAPGQGEVALSKDEIRCLFEDRLAKKLRYLDTIGPVAAAVRDRSGVLVADSRSQPLEDSSCDAVITSPPYLTRLDYVVGHLPELAVLGLSDQAIRQVRQRMIGTPTIQRNSSDSPHFPDEVERILQTVGSHESYAAKSYYEPVYRQYFEGMAISLNEISRVCKPRSKMALVVQDSWFKDVHINLAFALWSMARAHGWAFLGQKDFQNTRSMAQVNSKAHLLARTTRPVESILILETAKSSIWLQQSETT